MIQTYIKHMDIRLFAVLASVVLSVYTLIFADTPNDDAYTYIRTAGIFVNDGLVAAFDHYSWATYAVLIGLVSKLGFDLFSAAFLVNALFYALLVYAFLSIVRELDDSRTLLAWAALVVLVYPELNEFRYFVIRDIGFWALSLLAFWQYLRYAREGSLVAAGIFCAALIGATLFRAEAIVYLALTPFALLLDTRFTLPERRRRFLQLEGFVVGLLLLATVILTLAGLNIPGLFVEFVSVYQPFLINTLAPPPEQANAIGSALFGDYAADFSREYIGLFMTAGLFMILLANLAGGISGPYLYLLLYGILWRRISLRREFVVPWMIYIAINGLVLLGFLFITRYLSSRYAMLFCLMIVLLVPMIVCNGVSKLSDKSRRPMLAFLVVFFTYCAIDSYYTFGYSKQFVADATEWLAENEADTPALLTNNHAIAYASGKVVDYDKIERNLSEASLRQLPADGVIAVELNFTMSELLTRLETAGVLQRVTLFPHPADDTKGVAIYRRPVS